MTDIPRSHPCQNWMISHHFPHLQTLFGLHPRPSWDKNEGQIQLDNMHEHGKLLRPLAVPMAEDTSRKVQQLITVLHNEHHINEMTEKWLCQTVTKPASNSSILYPYENPQTDLGDLGSFRSNREVISICCHTTPAVSTTTEVVSQRLIQSTDAINFIDRTKVPENTILVSMDVTSIVY